MTIQYDGNSHKQREGLGAPKAEKAEKKKLEKVVSSEVVLQKKSFGRKVREIIAEADLRGVSNHVISNILIPSLRNMIFDASTKGIERVMYGEAAARRQQMGPGPRITYNSPIHRPSVGYPGARPAGQAAIAPGPRVGSRQMRDDIIVSSRHEAETVLERMDDVISQYEVVTWAELNELLGLPTSHVDNKWGWNFVGDAKVVQVREGYLIDLPPAEPIN